MSTAPVLFDRVWKKFRRGERHDSLRDLLPSIGRKLLGRRPVEELDAQEFWALQDVSFEVKAGEALGIIGPNGAGKSTALKLLTRILKPNRGACSVRGRVGALIEVAAGFHPDLTGRENILLQGAIMGMRRQEIATRLDDIIEFAGVRAFVDTPVKRYSSGMNARLGFSIAAHLNPDVLIIDEILSVGDMSFQQRCVERMKDFKRRGVTVVFVSHNLQAVLSLCDAALFLKQERRALGPTDEVVQRYLESLRESEPALSAEGVTIAGARFTTDAASTSALVPGERVTLQVTYRATELISDVTFGFVVRRSTDQLVVYDANVAPHELGMTSLSPGQTLVVDYQFDVNLTRGHYYIECHVFHNPNQRFLSKLSPAANFSVHETRTYEGVADLALTASRAAEIGAPIGVGRRS